jgi:uncharacterized protein involved in cysteine biosynthesis
MTLVAALAAARRDLGIPAVRRVCGLSILLGLALLVAAYALLLGLVDLAMPETLVIPLAGPLRNLGTLLSPGSILFALALSVMTMLPAAAPFAALMMGDLARAAGLGGAPPRPPTETAVAAANAAVLGAAAMLGAMMLVPVIGLAAFPVMWLAGGLALGLTWGAEACRLLLPQGQARAAARQHRRRFWAAGTVTAALLSVPFLNLAVPPLAALVVLRLVPDGNGAVSPSG